MKQCHTKVRENSGNCASFPLSWGECICLASFGRSTGFQTCRIADFQSAEPSPVRGLWRRRSVCGLETRDTAGLETCYSAVATLNTYGWERENRPPSAGVSDRFGSCHRRFWLFPPPVGREGHFVGNTTPVRHLFFAQPLSVTSVALLANPASRSVNGFV